LFTFLLSMNIYPSQAGPSWFDLYCWNSNIESYKYWDSRTRHWRAYWEVIQAIELCESLEFSQPASWGHWWTQISWDEVTLTDLNQELKRIICAMQAYYSHLSEMKPISEIDWKWSKWPNIFSLKSSRHPHCSLESRFYVWSHLLQPVKGFRIRIKLDTVAIISLKEYKQWDNGNHKTSQSKSTWCL